MRLTGLDGRCFLTCVPAAQAFRIFDAFCIVIRNGWDLRTLFRHTLKMCAVNVFCYCSDVNPVLMVPGKAVQW